MIRTALFLSMGLSVLFVNACTGNQSSTHKNSYAESQVHSDYQRLKAAEKALEEAGLKFESSQVVTPSGTSVTYSWDDAFLKSFEHEPAKLTASKMREALKNFVDIGERVINTYSQPFEIQGQAGQTEELRLLANTRSEIEPRVAVAKQTLKKLASL